MDLDAAEQTVNKSAAYVHQLGEALLKHEKDIKNITTSRATLS